MSKRKKPSSPSKLFASFKCFENLVPISKSFAKRYLEPFCLCSWRNFRKAVFSKKTFSKNGFRKDLFPKLLQMLYELAKIFGFSEKFKNGLKKGRCFQTRNYFKLLPYFVTKKINYFKKENCFQNNIWTKNRVIKKRCFHKWHLNLFHIRFWCKKNVFNWYSNSPKTMEKNDLERKFETWLLKISKFFQEMAFLQKLIRSSKSASTLFTK